MLPSIKKYVPEVIIHTSNDNFVCVKVYFVLALSHFCYLTTVSINSIFPKTNIENVFVHAKQFVGYKVSKIKYFNPNSGISIVVMLYCAACVFLKCVYRVVDHIDTIYHITITQNAYKSWPYLDSKGLFNGLLFLLSVMSEHFA